MRESKDKITHLIGILTFGVALAWFPWCAVIFWLVRSSAGRDLLQSHVLFYTLLGGSAAILLTVLGLLIYYLRYVASTPRLSPAGKALWATALLLAHVVAMPVFFYRHVWPDEVQRRTF